MFYIFQYYIKGQDKLWINKSRQELSCVVHIYQCLKYFSTTLSVNLNYVLMNLDRFCNVSNMYSNVSNISGCIQGYTKLWIK